MKALESNRNSGQIDGYKYAVKNLGANILAFFMDTTEQSESFYMVLFVSCVIAVFCWLILLLIVVLLSGKVFRPVIIGIEKQKQFITNTGHEMKTPLAIIQSNNETMALIHGENKYNVHIKNQTKRLNVLIPSGDFNMSGMGFSSQNGSGWVWIFGSVLVLCVGLVIAKVYKNY